MYALDIQPSLLKKLKKLEKKDAKRYEIVMKKSQEIIQNPQHYKNLHHPLQSWKRVHIDSHFVLAFSVDEKNKRVTLEDFDHHDNIYNY